MIIWLVTWTVLLRHCLANYNIININVTAFLFDCYSWSHSSWYLPGTHIVRFYFLASFLFHSWFHNHTHFSSRRFYFCLRVKRGTVIFLTRTDQLYDASLILSESLTQPSKAEYPGFLFFILFHVTCFKLRFIWIIKCFLKESFYTASLFLKLIIDVVTSWKD